MSAGTKPIGRPGLSVRPWRPVVTLASVVACAVLAAGALAGAVPFAVALILVSAFVVGGWVVLLNLPTPRGTAAVLASSAVVMVGCVLVSGRDGVSWLPAAIALSLIAEFGHQLGRRDGRPRLVESVSSTVAGIAVLASGVSMLPLAAYEGGPQVVLVLMVAAAVAAIADVAVRWKAPPLVGAVVAGGLGASAAAIGAAVLPSCGVPVLFAAAVGALAGSAGHLVRRVQAVLPYLYGRRAQLASAASSVLMLGVLANVAAWLGNTW
ncbi:MAG: hypothetical protein IPL37_07675 [Austwickia sp.]|nr:hypothetical protein [Austwickia sp.]